MRLVLRNEHPISQKPRRLSPLERSIVDEQVQEWLAQGIVRPSESEWASPVVLANKKDGTKRLCVDYRCLNKEIIRNQYPLPLIEDHIDALQRARIFTTLDLQNGFFHVPMASDSIKYTSFVTHSGQFEFLRMPFGLCTAPTEFQKFINRVFRPLIAKKVILVYIDDIVILSKDEDEGLARLREVIDIAQANGLRIKWEKFRFLCDKIEYLGYEVQHGKIKPSLVKTNAVTRFPEPTNARKLQSFLGLAGYFRKFVPDFATIAKPLSDLLRKEAEFIMGPAQKVGFQKLKDALSNQPVLLIYDPNAETQLHTDASKWGYGAVLLQKSMEDNSFHPVYYYSRKTTPVQERYSAYELEVLAIVNALKKLRVYLLGIPFKIITDCAAFKRTMEKKEISSRIAGWALALQEFNYQLEHRSGKRMPHVDALSRSPVVMFVDSELLSRLQSAQVKDEQFKLIMKILESGPYEDFIIERGILYKFKDGNKLLCIPRGMRGEIVKSVHNQGHFGAKKMEELLGREFFMFKQREEIEKCRRNCVRCILGDRKEGKQEGYLHPIPKGDSPLNTFHIDHLGPLTATPKQYKHLFVVIDSFSKYVWLHPVKTLSTSEAITKLDLQRSFFGNPQHIISDRGGAFRSNSFADYCKDEGIQLTLVTTGVPRGNGQVERTHRVIISVLTKLSIDNPESWYKHVDKLQRFINSSWHRSTGRTPFEVMFGVRMRNREDLRLSEIINEELYSLFDEQRDEVRAEAREQIRKVQEENRKTYNKRRKPARTYNLGDLVSIKRTQFGNAIKIHSKFLGPYRISDVLPNERYEVTKVGTHEGPQKTNTSCDNIKPWSSYEETDSESDSEFSSETDDAQHEDVPL